MKLIDVLEAKHSLLYVYHTGFDQNQAGHLCLLEMYQKYEKKPDGFQTQFLYTIRNNSK